MLHTCTTLRDRARQDTDQDGKTLSNETKWFQYICVTQSRPLCYHVGVISISLVHTSFLARDYREPNTRPILIPSVTTNNTPLKSAIM